MLPCGTPLLNITHANKVRASLSVGYGLGSLFLVVLSFISLPRPVSWQVGPGQR